MIILDHVKICADTSRQNIESCVIPIWTELNGLTRDEILELVAHMELNAHQFGLYVEGKVLEDAERIRQQIG